MAVTNNIREIREQRGIYQDDLAAAIGFSTKTVSRVERGDGAPSAEFMLRVSKYFNMLVMICSWIRSSRNADRRRNCLHWNFLKLQRTRQMAGNTE